MNATVDSAATLLLQYSVRDEDVLIQRGVFNWAIFGFLKSFFLTARIGHIHNRATKLLILQVSV